jgi:hypothetical protein
MLFLYQQIPALPLIPRATACSNTSQFTSAVESLDSTNPVKNQTKMFIRVFLRGEGGDAVDVYSPQ